MFFLPNDSSYKVQKQSIASGNTTIQKPFPLNGPRGRAWVGAGVCFCYSSVLATISCFAPTAMFSPMQVFMMILLNKLV